jgi:signal transduction histidine kinase
MLAPLTGVAGSLTTGGYGLARGDAMTHAAKVDELRASLARVFVASDEERRRIERDLHDGAQQHLVARDRRAVAVTPRDAFRP